MTAPKTKYPISSFGPELMAALTKGSRERVVLIFPSKRLAHRFQMRIHMLRQRMREENHPDYLIATRAKVSLWWGNAAVEQGGLEDWKNDELGNKGALIVIQPHDNEFQGVLTRAGVALAPLQISEPPEGSAPSVPESGDLLDEILGERTD